METMHDVGKTKGGSRQKRASVIMKTFSAVFFATKGGGGGRCVCLFVCVCWGGGGGGGGVGEEGGLVG